MNRDILKAIPVFLLVLIVFGIAGFWLKSQLEPKLIKKSTRAECVYIGDRFECDIIEETIQP